jgi:hypothetical protein
MWVLVWQRKLVAEPEESLEERLEEDAEKAGESPGLQPEARASGYREAAERLT